MHLLMTPLVAHKLRGSRCASLMASVREEAKDFVHYPTPENKARVKRAIAELEKILD